MYILQGSKKRCVHMGKLAVTSTVPIQLILLKYYVLSLTLASTGRLSTVSSVSITISKLIQQGTISYHTDTVARLF